MKSAFTELVLDSIRYSLVWEDAKTVSQALNLQPEDHVLVITSAGDNVLNVLLQNPATVTAVDLNPLQNKLLELKLHIIAEHEHSVLIGICGLNGMKGVTKSLSKLKHSLDTETYDYWYSYFQVHTEGLIMSGKLEQYIHSFYKKLDIQTQEKILRLLSFDDLTAQRQFYKEHLAKNSFRHAFIDHFDDKNLSKGRDVKLLQYASKYCGVVFYERFANLVETRLLKQNFYARFLFLGIDQMPSDLLPPYLQASNFAKLKSLIPKVSIVQQEAMDYLCSSSGAHISKASLSNIFEYVSPEGFMNSIQTLAKSRNLPIKIIFWNLLNEQGSAAGKLPPTTICRIEQEGDDRCFYFQNVKSVSIL